MQTTLLYLRDMYCLKCQAQVVQVVHDNEEIKVVLDQTVFYPQGGGQPSDKGFIKSEKSVFNVQHVSKEDEIFHKGTFSSEGSFEIGELVQVEVDEQVRILHNKNHTGGHLIDYALYNLGYKLIPLKAYHFPQGPYIEYQGTLEENDREYLQNNLEKAVNELVVQALPVKIALIENDPQKRSMRVGDYQPILCGGTHVSNTKEVGHVTIRKIKNEKGNVRVSYSVV